MPSTCLSLAIHLSRLTSGEVRRPRVLHSRSSTLTAPAWAFWGGCFPCFHSCTARGVSFRNHAPPSCRPWLPLARSKYTAETPSPPVLVRGISLTPCFRAGCVPASLNCSTLLSNAEHPPASAPTDRSPSSLLHPGTPCIQQRPRSHVTSSVKTPWSPITAIN